jgi:hypothetical protein
MTLSLTGRLMLLLTSLLAAYQVAVGIDDLAAIPIAAYTIAFGVLLVACLLLIILGFEVLESPVVVIVSTVIPLAMSFGLVWQHAVPPALSLGQVGQPAYSLQTAYLVYTITGFLLILITRLFPRLFPPRSRLPVVLLALVHGVAGLVIFLLPVVLAMRGVVRPLYALVGLGGALIGLGGLLLSFLKTGRPILSRAVILKILPGLLLTMTVCYVLGFL